MMTPTMHTLLSLAYLGSACRSSKHPTANPANISSQRLGSVLATGTRPLLAHTACTSKLPQSRAWTPRVILPILRNCTYSVMVPRTNASPACTQVQRLRGLPGERRTAEVWGSFRLARAPRILRMPCCALLCPVVPYCALLCRAGGANMPAASVLDLVLESIRSAEAIRTATHHLSSSVIGHAPSRSFAALRVQCSARGAWHLDALEAAKADAAVAASLEARS